jgi:hypothetical protein
MDKTKTHLLQVLNKNVADQINFHFLVSEQLFLSRDKNFFKKD